MKLQMLGFAIAAALIGGTVHAQEFTVDKDHSKVKFGVRHIRSIVDGQFKEFEGSFKFDEKKPENSSGKFVVQSASISTDNQKRDDHLKSADFFEVEKYKTLEFTTKKITKAKAKDSYKMEGDLTIRGVTKNVNFDLEYLGKDKDPWGGTRAGFVAKTKINRKDYGISFNKVLDSGGLLVGDDVEITLNVEGIEKAAEKAPEKKN